MNKYIYSVIFLLSLFLYSHSTYSQHREIKLLFRFDDYHLKPTSFNYSLLDLFKKYNVPLCIGIIPNKDDSLIFELSSDQLYDFRERIRRKEIEIALHGYNHKDNGLNSQHKFIKHYKSEFASLSFTEQFSRIKIAKYSLEKLLNSPVTIFIPPWNSYDKTTLNALDSLNFQIISSDLHGVSSSDSINYIPVHNEDIFSINELISKSESTDEVYTVLIHPYTFSDDEEFTTMSAELHSNLEKLLTQITSHPSIRIYSFHQLNEIENFGPERYEAHKTKNNFLIRVLKVFDKYQSSAYRSVEIQTKIKLTYTILNFFFHVLLFFGFFLITLFIKRNFGFQKTLIALSLIAALLCAVFLIWISMSPAFISMLIFFSTVFSAVLLALLLPEKLINSRSDDKIISLNNNDSFELEKQAWFLK